MFNPEPTPDRLPNKGTGAPWGHVYGELLTFDDPEARLPAIDRLEGFHPHGPCLYRRVLVTVRTNGAKLPAWLYLVRDRWIGTFKSANQRNPRLIFPSALLRAFDSNCQ
ncbi:gamma-glutamylcyclotransferase family protein [Desulfatiglans anilini]|uniref:gamma-glutamylcyclotransferase family protein n=1 Tax=Desulfatiglans anilini TaxID=90728 RepID=UPI0012946D18